MLNKVRKYITIHDIARQAGVSASTVSRVLNGNTTVAPDKREAVLLAVEGLNYHPNVVARGLVRGKSSTIGVVTQNMASLFYGEIIKGIERGLYGSDYHPVTATGNWRIEEEMEALDLLVGRRVDGLIVLNGQLPEDRLRHVAEQIPLVMVGRNVPGLEQYCLLVENFQGSYRATRHLIDLGHTRIAHIGGIRTQQDAIDRREGYCQALLDGGLEVDPDLILEGDFEERSGLLAVDALINRNLEFTAIFSANDQMAYGARLALFHHGLRVPEDVSLVGFDDQLGCAYAIPPLTTVRQPLIELGIASAQAILHILDGEPAYLPVLSTELIIRESTMRRPNIK